MKSRSVIIIVLVQVAATTVLLAAYLLVWRAPAGQQAGTTAPNVAGQALGAFRATPPPTQAMYRGNPGRTGFYDSAEIQAIHGVKWEIGRYGTVTTAPVVAGKTVYFGSMGGAGDIVGVDTSTGRQVFAFKARFTDGAAPADIPTIMNGTLFFGGNQLVALDAQSAAVKWTYQAGAEAPVLAADGAVFFTSKQNLYAIDAATGTLRWTYPANADELTAPALGEGLVFLGGGGSYDVRAGHEFVAVDGNSGREAWRLSLPAPVSASPAVSDGVVFFPTTRIDRSGGGDPRFPANDTVTGTLHAVDVRTGAELWKFETAAILDKPVAVAGNLVFLDNKSEPPAATPADHTGCVRALDARTGAVRWELETGAPSTPPSVAGSLVYLAAAGSGPAQLLALDAATGMQKWSYPVDELSVKDLTIYDGVIYLAGDKLHALY